MSGLGFPRPFPKNISHELTSILPGPQHRPRKDIFASLLQGPRLVFGQLLNHIVIGVFRCSHVAAQAGNKTIASTCADIKPCPNYECHLVRGKDRKLNRLFLFRVVLLVDTNWYQ